MGSYIGEPLEDDDLRELIREAYDLPADMTVDPRA